MYRGQRTPFWNQFPHSTLWVPKVELQSSGLPASPFSSWTSLPAHYDISRCIYHYSLFMSARPQTSSPLPARPLPTRRPCLFSCHTQRQTHRHTLMCTSRQRQYMLVFSCPLSSPVRSAPSLWSPNLPPCTFMPWMGLCLKHRARLWGKHAIFVWA